MGARGPQPTPTLILKARGSKLVRGRAGEPQPAPEVPLPPRWMLPAAKRCWTRIVREAAKIGLLTLLDRDVLTAACIQWGHYVVWQKKIAVLPSDVDFDVARRMHAAADVALKGWLQCARELGLSPAARTRVRLPEAKPAAKDGKGRFFAS